MAQVFVSSDISHYLRMSLESEWTETESEHQSINHKNEVYYF